MKIRAAVLDALGAATPYAETQPLTIETLDLQSPGHGEVLVRIAAAGLCHSDLSVINGDRPRPVPMALGHEAAGVVEEVGPGRGRFEPRRRTCSKGAARHWTSRRCTAHRLVHGLRDDLTQ